jgi:hypothetical protein
LTWIACDIRRPRLYTDTRTLILLIIVHRQRHTIICTFFWDTRHCSVLCLLLKSSIIPIQLVFRRKRRDNRIISDKESCVPGIGYCIKLEMGRYELILRHGIICTQFSYTPFSCIVEDCRFVICRK